MITKKREHEFLKNLDMKATQKSVMVSCNVSDK